VALEALALHDGEVTVGTVVLLHFMALEAEDIDSGTMQLPVKSMTLIAPAESQGTVASLPEKSRETRAMRIVAGQAGRTVAANTGVGTHQAVFIGIMAPGAEGIAFRNHHQPLLVAVVGMALGAAAISVGRVNALFTVAEAGSFVAVAAALRGGGRGNQEKERAENREKQDLKDSHVSFLPLFRKWSSRR
jgi:hypothetical protein